MKTTSTVYTVRTNYALKQPVLRTLTRFGPGGSRMTVVQGEGDAHRTSVPSTSIFETPVAAWRHYLAERDQERARIQNQLDDVERRMTLAMQALAALGEPA